MNQKVPVFLITGFLESGKTNFLADTIGADYFQIDENSILFITEEGIDEYDDEELMAARTIPILVEEPEDMTPEFMMAMVAKHHADRVIIEWNGMWDPAALVLPEGWFLHQQVMLVDATTLDTYYQNGDMRSILARLALNAEVVICNRCDPDTMDLSKMKRELMSLNSRAEIVMESEEGEVSLPFEPEELPYDISGDVVQVGPEHYGVFFMDAGDSAEHYEGKTVVYTGMVNKPRGMRKDEFVFGRVAINGCVDPNCVDVNCEKVFLGYLAKFKNAYALKDRAWIRVTTKIRKEFVKEYGEEGPVLYVEKVEPAEPIQGYVTFG